MDFCTACGAVLGDEGKVCPNCGTPIENSIPQPEPAPAPVAEKKELSPILIGLISFFFTPVGLTLFLVWRNEKPAHAKAGLIGFIVGYASMMLFSIGMGVLSFILSFTGVLVESGGF